MQCISHLKRANGLDYISPLHSICKVIKGLLQDKSAMIMGVSMNGPLCTSEYELCITQIVSLFRFY